MFVQIISILVVPVIYYCSRGKNTLCCALVELTRVTSQIESGDPRFELGRLMLACDN